MKRIRAALALLALAAALPLLAADDAKQREDLAAVIALQGKPCGEVVRVETLGENDYVATCKDGSRYHVYVNKQGRVVVEKR
ncbi:MAG TPA: hypothetical protein VLS49_15465 [Usitatibacter sp.]|nr:hypothetical protein [Usitatibacter sp.]